jgi:subtilisin family serine protease
VRVTTGQRSVQLSVGYGTEPQLAAALRSTRAHVVRRLSALHVVELRTTAPLRVSAALRRAPGIRFVQRTAGRSSVSEPGVVLASMTPRAVWEWQIRVTHADIVPASVLRAASSIEIAVIDTGADLTAPDLAAKSPLAYNTRTGTTDVRDQNGHGTFVASIAAGSVTNGDGIAGSGGDAQLLVVKAGNAHGSFTDVDEAAAIMYSVDHGAKVINLSVGGPTTSATEQRAIQYAVQHGVLVVAAVGNEFGSGNPVEYPAALLQPTGSNGIGGVGLAVTASTSTGERASFANTGSWVSLAAPGENVFGDVSQDSSPTLYPRSVLPGAISGLYGYASGTSFAAPQVTGAAALVWAANPSLTAEQVAQILKETASGAGRWSPDLGFGVIDVAAAVARAQAGVPGVLLSGSRVDTHMQLNWSGDATRYSLSLSKDSSPATTVLSGTQTSTTLTLARGHSYSFTVEALDASGAPAATSAPLTLAVGAARPHR